MAKLDQTDKALAKARHAVERLREARHDLERTEQKLDRADQEVAEAERNSYAQKRRHVRLLEALVIGLLGKQHETWKNRRAGADETNTRYQASRRLCEKTAHDLWAADAEREFTKGDIIRLCKQELQKSELHVPNDKVLWGWLQKANLVPEYASRPGRRRSPR